MVDPADRAHVEVENKTLLTIAAMAAMVMQILDTTIANVALPHMQASLGATQDSVSWVLTSYLMASAIAIPITGWLSDQIGARALFLWSVGIFVIASALCGAATSLSQMVGFRVLQGMAGAFLGPLVQTILLDINRPSQHGKAMAVYGMGIMIAPIAGPILGGWLTENFDWRWVFYVNVPIGGMCLFALWFLLPRIKTTPRKFDLTGWLLIAIGLSAFQLMLDRGQHVDWFNSTEIWIETGVAIGAMWMFMVHLFTGREPLFPPGMLADSNLIAGSFFMFMMGLVAYAGMALIPPMLQTLYGYTVIDTGVALASRGFGVLITMGVAGRISGLIDPRLIVGSGFAMVAFSLWMMTGWSLDMDWHPVMLSGFIQGLGLGFIFVPLNVLSFATLAPKYRTDGAGFFNLARSIGSSIGIAIAASMLARNLQGSHEVLAGHITPYNLAIDPSVTETMGSAGDAAMAMVDAMVNREAAMLAYLDDFHMMMMATLIVMPLLIFIKPPRKGKAGPPIILGE